MRFFLILLFFALLLGSCCERCEDDDFRTLVVPVEMEPIDTTAQDSLPWRR